MPAIQFKKISPTEEDKAPIVALTVAPIVPPASPVKMNNQSHLPQLPKNRFNIRIEWVRHSRSTCLVYFIFGVLLTSYYSACFLTQYGTIDKMYDLKIKPMPILDESTLTRVIMVQWLLLAIVLLSGLSVFRRIFMPLYIFLAVMATNGTLVLFVVKMKQFTDGKVAPNDLSLNLVGILLVTVIAHNLVYLYAMHLHFTSRIYSRVPRTSNPIIVVPVVKDEKSQPSL